MGAAEFFAVRGSTIQLQLHFVRQNLREFIPYIHHNLGASRMGPQSTFSTFLTVNSQVLKYELRIMTKSTIFGYFDSFRDGRIGPLIFVGFPRLECTFFSSSWQTILVRIFRIKPHRTL